MPEPGDQHSPCALRAHRTSPPVTPSSSPFFPSPVLCLLPPFFFRAVQPPCRRFAFALAQLSFSQSCGDNHTHFLKNSQHFQPSTPSRARSNASQAPAGARSRPRSNRKLKMQKLTAALWADRLCVQGGKKRYIGQRKAKAELTLRRATPGRPRVALGNGPAQCGGGCVGETEMRCPLRRLWCTGVWQKQRMKEKET